MQALILQKDHDQLTANIQSIPTEQLPPGDVIIDIYWSTLNYKDALAINGKAGVVRQYPMVPGIDFSGVVHHSEDPRFSVGQHVLLTGWGVGETHWGGLATQARVPADYLTPLPENLSLRQAMIIGTAGFTAMLCVNALQDAGITPDKGEIIVSGASGGVGSTAIQLLSQLGYDVVAISGRAENSDYLLKIGAKRVLARSDFTGTAKPLDKQHWAGAIDTVGGEVLANILAQTQYNGAVAACGLAGGFSLPTTVMPFILRNIRLQGVDSVYYPASKRPAVWQRLSQLLPESFYSQITSEITLEQSVEYAQKFLKNQITGRTLVKILTP
ncbi:oxidoreductase [Providencia stuartii]|uniref:Oxidoreductase n=1 Tax=Providencia manganoxydans TaxID=2923283 RepID=A0ABX7AD16_9GAMM|nr:MULTISPECIES: oxidoreductase [Providencia]ELR5300143.1 oxidoreductase [Providencia stuartii]MDW7589220.1 oxidoreductase [Providencia sp. 2023EL-00965]MDX4946273.1 oxidoreductase [Providencia manganoxydans]QQO61854.1 oxidoreductase [Providencia manganoxydans]HEF8771578.1 oxidoreductase [Providencia stuartii]